jgi:hypothetical protein
VAFVKMLPEEDPYTPNAGAEPRYLAGLEPVARPAEACRLSGQIIRRGG